MVESSLDHLSGVLFGKQTGPAGRLKTPTIDRQWLTSQTALLQKRMIGEGEKKGKSLMPSPCQVAHFIIIIIQLRDGLLD